MPNLKDLKVRIDSVKSTRKITSAMKMVAASKFRRAQELAEATRPYAEAMTRIMTSLTSSMTDTTNGPKLLTGTGKKETIALVVVTSDRGLCGAFNSQVVREARRQIRALTIEGKQVKLICAGRKGRDLLRREHGQKIIAYYDDIGRKGGLGFFEAEKIARPLLDLFEKNGIDMAYLVYNHFKNVLTQVVTLQQLIPVPLPKVDAEEKSKDAAQALYEFEPDEETILADLLPRNVGVQVYRALLDSAAGEQGARMTAMDNATRNAGDMINKLTLQYNRARQAYITKEMIEIVTGAEAV
jgi:F-type H+-transporting ATPase subunit gamma